MSVTHAAAARNAMAGAVLDLIDGGAAAGSLEMQTSGNAEVATLAFSDPAFGSPSNGAANANAISDDTDATGGTIAKAVAKDSDGTTVLSCSVTGSGGGGDIELSSAVISAGQKVSLSSLSYTAPT